MKTKTAPGKTRIWQTMFCLSLICVCNINAFSTSRNWKGSNSSDWNDPANWSPSGVPAAGDILSIGVVNFTNQPIISSAPSAPGSLILGVKKSVTITVNNGFTLTVNGSINQNPSNSSYGTFTNTLAGAGTISCTTLNVGDNSTFAPLLSNNFLSLVSTISNLHVTGNVTVNSTNYGVIFVGIGYNNAKFSLQGGTTLIDGTLFTANTSSGILPTTYAAPSFSVDISSALNPVLQLSNIAPINTSSVNGSIDFYNNTGGTGTSTVYYNGTDQTIYANTTACLDNAPQTYQNLVFSGTGTKTVGTAAGSTLLVASNLSNSATTTDCSVYNPIISIGNLWLNAGNVTAGTGAITAGNLQNTAGTITLASATTTIGAAGIQLSGGQISCAAGTVTDNGIFQNSGGTLACGNGSLILMGDYQNTTGTFAPGSGTVFFSGANQSLYDNSSAGTRFRKVTFNATGTATITPGTGNFLVADNGTLAMVSPAKLVAGSTSPGGAAYLTLQSTANATATVAAITGTSNITGAVNAERFISGGASSFRGYRLLSQPVNSNNLINFTSGTGYIDLSYLNKGTGAILTAGLSGPTNGFSVTNTNPLIYLYDESLPTNYANFVAGKNVGITAISTNNVNTLSGTTATNGVKIPVGNSILLYYVGSNKSPILANTRVPDSAKTTATGYLNQGDAPVVFWNTSSTVIPFHHNGSILPGMNQVGNPYASTISLDQLAADNPGISPIFWELNDQTGGAYISYNANGTTSNTRASKYIVSGQGFMVQADTTGQTITFKEDQKVSYPSAYTSLSSPGALLLSMPATASRSFVSLDTAVSLTGLHLQLTADSVTNSQTGIYFNSAWSDAYQPGEDAVDMPGASKVQLASLSANGIQLGINELSDYATGKRIKLYTQAAATGIYTLSLADLANIDTSANSIFLVDHKMNDSLDMVRYHVYSFNLNITDTTTYGANRFILVIAAKHKPPQALSPPNDTKSVMVKSLIIYPNPAFSTITISLGTNAPTRYSADIYNISGTLLKHEQQNSGIFKEDISNYKLGVYIVEVKDANGNLFGQSKFVKTN